MDNIIKVNDENFNEIVLNSTIPVVVTFSAEWCGACKMISPILDMMRVEYSGHAIITKVDVDNSPETSNKYGIRNIPATLYFKNGEVVDKQVGAAPKSTLVNKLNAII